MNVHARVQDAVHPDIEPVEHPGRERPLVFDLWQLLQLRQREFAGAAVGMFVAINLLAFTIPSRYEGNARVMLDTRQNNVVNVQQVLIGLTPDQADILDQMQILQSRELVGRVVDKLRLDLDPEFAGGHSGSLLSFLNPLHYLRKPVDTGYTPEQERQFNRERVIDNFLGHLSVDQIQLSTAINITHESHDPAKAALSANGVADASVEDQLNALQRRLHHGIRYRLLISRQQLSNLGGDRTFSRILDVVHRRQQRVDDLAYRLRAAQHLFLDRQRRRIEIAAVRIRHHDLRRVLSGMRRDKPATRTSSRTSHTFG